MKNSKSSNERSINQQRQKKKKPGKNDWFIIKIFDGYFSANPLIIQSLIISTQIL